MSTEDVVSELDKVVVNSFDIKGDEVSTVDASDKEAELKEQLSEEDMKKLQDEFKKEVERLEDKYEFVEASIAETIEVEDMNPIEAMRVIEDREDLEAFCEIKDGLGFSASQLGIGKKWFIARDMSAPDNPFKIYFNPKYFPNGSTRQTFAEACLTYPGEQVEVKRWKNITFHWFGFDENGEWKKFKKNIKGLNAVVLQHETDHCGNLGNKPITIMTRKHRKVK